MVVNHITILIQIARESPCKSFIGFKGALSRGHSHVPKFKLINFSCKGNVQADLEREREKIE